MVDRSDKVRIEGLSQVQKALRNADRELAKGLATEQRKLADFVVGKAEARAAGQGGVAAKVARGGALKAKGEQRFAKVVLDGGRFPFVFGAEFGAVQYRQFKPWRGNQYTDPLGQEVGYFLHPTLRAEREHIFRFYEGMIEGALLRLERDY